MRAVIFTYPPDYLMASYAAASLRRCGVGVTLAIDEKDPRLVVDDCDVVRTSFERRGNLNGMATVIGQLETLERARDGSPYILKVDSDTVATAMDWLAGKEEDVVGLRSNEDLHKRSLYGFCYGVRETSIERMLEAARDMPDNAWCPEDIMTATIAAQVGSVFTYRHKDPGVRLGAFRWTDSGSTADWVREFDVLCFQRGMMMPNGGKSTRQDIQRAMKRFLPA